MGRGFRRCVTIRRLVVWTLHAESGTDRCGDARAPGLRQPLRSKHVPREQRRAEARGHHGCDAESCEWRNRQGRERKGDRRSQGRSRRYRPPCYPADSVRAAADAGQRRAQGGARGRRDHDPGPDVGRAIARVSGVTAARRADIAHHAAPDARQRHAHRCPRHHPRLRRRLAEVHRLQGVGRRHHGQQRGDVL